MSMCRVPSTAKAFLDKPWSADDVLERASILSKGDFIMSSILTPRTGRQYIVVGGSGFVGGWIILQLLARGEKPQNIRIVDLRPPVRKDMLSGAAAKVAFIKANICDIQSLRSAFAQKWPEDSEQGQGMTIFHTAATIRFFERYEDFLPLSTSVNVEGTGNALSVAREYGADTFIFTSSTGVGVRPTSIWLWPFQGCAPMQVMDDSTHADPNVKHHEFFSNYAYSKHRAEHLVRAADSPKDGFRTGCLRPGMGVYGYGGDTTAEAYIIRKTMPVWCTQIIQNWIYVENVAYAHLLYEQRLVEQQAAGPSAVRPGGDIGGQSFSITNSGQPVRFCDMHSALSTLTNGETKFYTLPPVLLLLFAYAVEMYCLLRHRSRIFAKVLPLLTGDVLLVQPAMFTVCDANLIIDDSRIRRPVSEGGLGYDPPWQTLDGLCKLVRDYKRHTMAQEDEKGSGVFARGHEATAWT